MGGSSLLFNPSQGIRLRAQPTAPLRPRTGPSSCCPYRRDAVQRCLAIRSEANKGVQSGRNSKPNPELSSNSNSKNSTDDSRMEQIVSFLNKIEASIKGSSALEPKERSKGEQKKQSLEPKTKDKKTFFGHKKSLGIPSNLDKVTRDDGNKAVGPPRDNVKSSGPPSFVKLTRDDGNRAVAPPRDNIKPSGPPSFAKLTRDEGNKAGAPARDNIKPSGPLSNFARLTRDEGNKAVAPQRDDKKSSGPPSNFDKFLRDDGNTAVAFPLNDKKSSGPPSNFDKLIRDDGNNAVSTLRGYKPPRPTSRFVRRSPIPIPKDQPPSVIVREGLEMSVSDEMPVIVEKEEPSKSGLESEPTSELEAMTLSELRDIAKAQGLKGYSKFKKAKLVEILKGTSL